MRRGKFHRERMKMVLGYGSAVASLEALPAERRQQAVPPPPMTFLACASSEATSTHSHRSTYHQSSWIFFFTAAWDCMKNMHPPWIAPLPGACVLVQAPLGTF